MKPLVYLASPYTHKKASVMEARFKAACIAAGYLMRQGNVVFSPIAHSHPIHKYSAVPNTFEFWVNGQDLPILSLFDKLVVLTLPGWEKSDGVQGEILHKHKHCVGYDKLSPVEAGIPADIVEACGKLGA